MQAGNVDNTGNLRFKNMSSSFAATFFMMLDNLQYDNILLNYKGTPGNGLVLYVLYIAYCFMMPIIFLNLLVSYWRLFFFFFFVLLTFVKVWGKIDEAIRSSDIFLTAVYCYTNDRLL